MADRVFDSRLKGFFVIKQACSISSIQYTVGFRKQGRQWMRLDRPNDLLNFQGLLEDKGGLLTGFFGLSLIHPNLILQGLIWNFSCCSGHLKSLAVLTHIEAVFFFQPRMFCYLSQQGT